MEAAGAAILILGAVCIIAAIIGGNVSLPGGTTFAALTSKPSRVTLAIFALILFFLGSILLVVALAQSMPTPIAPGPHSIDPTEDSLTQTLPDSFDSRMQYTESANTICRESESAVAQLERPDGSDANEIDVGFVALKQIRQDQLSQLRNLDIPVGDEVYINEIENSLSTHIDAIENLIQANYLGGILEDSYTQFMATSDQFNLTVRNYNLSDCIFG